MNNTQIPIDELYDQLTLILQAKKKLNQEITTIRRNVFSGQSFED